MRNYYYNLITILILLLNINLTAQETGTLRGTVIDSLKGEALPFSNILVEGTNIGSSADVNGVFTIPSVPANRNLILRISYLGYETKRIETSVSPGKITQIRVQLKPSSVQLQTIEKVGEKMSAPNETDLGLQKISIRQIELLPKSVETDILRSLQYMPGVKSTGDVSARYYVRGGGSDQNLVLLNGVPVYNPFHALGLFSVIDPEMINAVEFYRGGFSAEYGGRLSSVLNLVTKDGNRNRFGGSASASFLTAKTSIQGPIPEGSFIFTGRRSLFNNVLKKFVNYKDAPFQFHDISFKASYTPPNTETLTKLMVHGFNSLDEIKNESDFKEDYKWLNNIYGVYWFQAWENIPLYSETNVAYSGFEGSIDPKLGRALERTNRVSDLSLKTDFTYVHDSRDETKVGFILKSFSSELDFQNLRGTRTNIEENAIEFSVFAKYKLLRNPIMGIDFGTRANILTLTKQRPDFFEPRINFTYRPLVEFAIKGAWGIYTQSLTTLIDENEIISLFEPWVIIPSYLPPSKSVHYVLGAEYNYSENFSVSLETYYKDIINTAEFNQNKYHDKDPDLISSGGSAYGFEVLIKYYQSGFNGTASYSSSWAYRERDGYIYYPRFDSRHSMNLNASYDFGSGWEFSALFILNSGLPFTQILGFYDKAYFDNFFTTNYLFNDYRPYTILGGRNLGRLPFYHRLDLSINKKLNLGFMNMEFSASVMNVYNRKNVFYFERDTGERVNMLPILPTATIKIEL